MDLYAMLDEYLEGERNPRRAKIIGKFDIDGYIKHIDHPYMTTHGKDGYSIIDNMKHSSKKYSVFGDKYLVSWIDDTINTDCGQICYDVIGIYFTGNHTDGYHFHFAPIDGTYTVGNEQGNCFDILSFVK